MSDIKDSKSGENLVQMTGDYIAIIGMAGRFPGAANLEAFWDNLCAGAESIKRFSDEELGLAGVSSDLQRSPGYVKARAILEGVDLFDADFFGMPPREAILTDPQHRLFLEDAWHALEDAGYNPFSYQGSIGVYAGLSLNTYLLSELARDPAIAQRLTENHQTGEYQTLLGNDKDFLATRVSYKLNLRGPSMTVQTACSTSLVAVAQACQSLLTYQCDMALAGGVAISFPQYRGYFHEPGGLASNDGHCRTFDADAQGTVFGDGLGIVVLKRLDEAITDGDQIYAVIRGFAVNNDGASKVGYSAPGVRGQAEVVAMAMAMAEVDASSIGYIEAHGTGTPLGDPIEIAALTEAFRRQTDQRNFCAIGSVKTNIGHLEVAAGVSALIKTALAIKYGKIPPSLHFKRPNPKINLESSPFYVATTLHDWPKTSAPRRAGISSFGVGGTNAHLVLEQPPAAVPTPASGRELELVLLSAKTRRGLEQMSNQMVEFLSGRGDGTLADLAYTLQVGRRAFEHRRMFFARDRADAADILKRRDVARVFSKESATLPAQAISPSDTFGTLAHRWLEGEDVQWHQFYALLAEKRQRVSLPGYPFQRQRFWLEASNLSNAGTAAVSSELGCANTALPGPAPTSPILNSTPRGSRKVQLIEQVKQVLADVSGKDLSTVDLNASFFDLGLDSLFLTQVGQALRKRFGVKITFAQLLDKLDHIEAVASFLDENLSPEEHQNGSTAIQPERQEGAATTVTEAPASTDPVLERMTEQLAAISRQLEAMKNGNPVGNGVVRELSLRPVRSNGANGNGSANGNGQRFGPYKPIDKKVAGGLSEQQREYLESLIERYTSKTAKSKAQTQEDRRRFADPRAVSSFNRLWKEMVYPIIVERSAGAHLWDVDGNDFVDLTMGFGTNLLGHTPGFIQEAISEQVGKGIEVGPSTPLAGKVAAMLAEMTGHERVAFCNTGSEAVLAAIRLARTVTGRTRIATTSGFHGICDEVLVRANVVNGVRRTVPIAPGIPEHVAKEVLVLDYGTEESIALLKENAHELAAILIEPVQSRRPDLQPVDFLREVRRITRESGVALIFDEVITGFRCHPGGAQALFGVQADLATYGKIIGAGLPIGALAGSAQYMDALDGGFWEYGNSSLPEVGVTFFAGTYVRHPLAMAASWAILNRLRAAGPDLQSNLNLRTRAFVQELNDFLQARNVPLHIATFSSLFYLEFDDAERWGSLLYFHLRERGIHLWEGRPGFLSTAHSEADLNAVVTAFKQTVIDMQAAGFLRGDRSGSPGVRSDLAKLPVWEHPSGQTDPRLQAANLSPSTVVAERFEPTKPGLEPIAAASRERPSLGTKTLEFSLYFFGNYPAAYTKEKYRLLIEAAKFADQHGFTAIWLPERHFHSVGGFSPNPAILAATLAQLTARLQLRGGSVVLPLHNPVRVAEEWAVVDNLSNGRAGISVASGWHPNDFVLAPENFERRRELSLENLATIQHLWRGDSLTLKNGVGSDFIFRIFPQPKQPEPPVWLTCIHRESFIKAGELGVSVLCHLMNTTLEEVSEKIELYRDAFARAGHDPAKAHVTLLLHTFVGSDLKSTREQAHKPLTEYLRSFLDNSQKRLESERGDLTVDEADVELLLERAFNDYVEGKSLIGTPDSCAPVVERLRGVGVDELGCFIDFGIEPDAALAALSPLVELKRRFEESAAEGAAKAMPVAVLSAKQAGIEPVASGSRDEWSRPGRVIPLTKSQSGLWALGTTDPQGWQTYNETVTLRLRGPYDHRRMERALQAVVDRHEALRAYIAPEGDTQIITRRAIIHVPLIDMSQLSKEEREARASEYLEGVAGKPFDLTAAPYFRAQTVKLDEEYHLLGLTFHHLLGNGPSYWVFLGELCTTYAGEGDLPVPMQLSEFVRRQAELGRADDDAFWRAQFSEAPPTLELPLDRPRPQIRTFKGGRAVAKLNAELCRGLRKVGSAKRCSLFMTLFSAFNILLHRLTGQEDVVVGVAYGSGIRDLDGGSALFANTTNVLPLRSRVELDPRFIDYLESIKALVVDASEHQEYFFGRILDALRLSRDPSRSPLFSVLFNYESGEFRHQVAGLDIELVTGGFPSRGPLGTSMCELYFNLAEKSGDELELQCDYRADLFDPQTVERWLGHFKTLLESITVDPTQRVHELALLTAAEREQLMVEWSGQPSDFPRNSSIDQLFEEQALRTPDAVAVEEGDLRWTYRELNARADLLARALHDAGAKTDSLVGLCLDRSTDFILGMIAILKIGCAYVPIDPAYPLARRLFMLEGVPVLLTKKEFTHDLSTNHALIVRFEDVDFEGGRPPALLHRSNGESLAYVMFTSGSTGQPKGVAVKHCGVSRLVLNTNYVALDVSDVVAHISNPCFDAATFEIWGALLNGARLVVLHRDITLSPIEFAHEAEQRGITTMFLTTSLFNVVAQEAPKVFGKMRHVLFGGEAADPQSVATVLREGAPQHLINGYGPTETTTFAVCHAVRSVPTGATSIPIGRPISNTTVYLLDRHLQPVPVGVTGALYIGGPGVASGYHCAPELTAERFIRDPFAGETDARLYQTGDLARWLPDGLIDYMGRADTQVKIRGFRIEPSEIEAVLRQHPAVRDAAVVLHTSLGGKKRLIGYVSSGHSQVGDGALRDFLRTRLPDYMLPVVIMVLERLPLTSNGKIDRGALPAPAQLSDRFTEPNTPLERRIAAIWESVLGVERVGVDDNFFELGGDSLTSVRVANQLRELTQERVSPIVILQAPTVGLLAQLLTKTFDLNGNSQPANTEARIDDEKIEQMRALIEPGKRLVVSKSTKNPRAIFILSPMRSGSTLTRIMLSGHPDLFAPPELHLLQFATLAEREDGFAGYDRYMLEGTIRAIMEIEQCGAEQAKRHLAELSTSGCTVQEFYGHLQARIAPRILVDKTPDYAMDVEVLRRAEQYFENPFYIHLTRHPLGMIRSYDQGRLILESPYRGRHQFSGREIAELTWIVSHENILAFLDEIPGDRKHRMQFEQLVREPQKALEAFCSAAGIDFDPAMLRPYEDGRMIDGVKPDSQQVGDHKFAEHKALRADVADSWRKSYQESSLGARTLDMAEKLGYETYRTTAAGPAPAIPVRQERKPSLTLIPIQSSGLRPPFFGVHGGYGFAMFYSKLAHYLSADQPLYGIQSEGIDGCPVKHTSIESMASFYLEEIRSVYPTGPYFLGGYCLGGVVAFEMAQQLQAAGEEVGLLALFDTNNPALPPRRYTAAERLKRKLHTATVLPPKRKLQYLTQRLAVNLKNSGKVVLHGFHRSEPDQIDEADINMLSGVGLSSRIFPTLDHACKTYQPQVYPNRITLFRATRDYNGYEYAADRGWTELAGKDLEIHDVAGEHGTMFLPPYVMTLARQLDACISAAIDELGIGKHLDDKASSAVKLNF